MSEEVIVRPCLCCDAHTAVKKEDWKGEAPAALCQDCAIRITMGMILLGQVRLLYQLRCRVVGLQQEQELMKKDITRLYTGQKDLEADLLRSTRRV